MLQKNLIDAKKLSEIIDRTIEVVGESRNEIIYIVETTKNEYEKIKKELQNLRIELSAIISEVDSLQIEEKRARATLMAVSKNFQRYTENDIKVAYEAANNIRVKLILKNKEEQNLISRRKQLEKDLKKTLETLERAENIEKQISVAIKYLKGNFSEVFETIEDLSKKQSFGIKIIEAQEDERQRVARDIHDGPAQTMANVVLKAELCEKLLNIDIEKTREELKNLKGIVRNSLKDIRRIIYDLRPMSLDDLGLVPTIQRYIDNFINETGIYVELSIIGIKENIESVVKISCFRIIQEALNNIRKHSNAKTVIIKVQYNSDNINLLVKDDGIGFDTSNNMGMTESGGFGLVSMRERAELLNGKLQVISKPNEGARVIVMIPLSKEDD